MTLTNLHTQCICIYWEFSKYSTGPRGFAYLVTDSAMMLKVDHQREKEPASKRDAVSQENVTCSRKKVSQSSGNGQHHEKAQELRQRDEAG